jgi:serine/threonine protein kinase
MLLGDLGWAKIFKKRIDIYFRAQAFAYRAPESKSGAYDFKLDVWSLGIIFI